MNLENIPLIDKTIQDIKQILRTPISIKCGGSKEDLPNLLMRVLNKGWIGSEC